MDYPDNFKTSAFTAGSKIAISRAMAIGTLVVFFISVYICGLIIWSHSSKNVSPYLISTNPDTGVWSVVAKQDNKIERDIYYTVQESLVANTIKNWFTVGPDIDENAIAWEKCDADYCAGDENFLYGTRKCAISCSVSDDVYFNFSDTVLPHYNQLEKNGEMWTINPETLDIIRTSEISSKGGNWLARGTVVSNTGREFYVRVFVNIRRAPLNYPQTMGFYVSDFNAYRVK